MLQVGIDIGTTSSKVGVYDEKGTELKVLFSPTKTNEDEIGFYINPDTLWNCVLRMLMNLLDYFEEEFDLIGVTSMAEGGLFIDPISNSSKSYIIPWYDKRTEDISKTNEEENIKMFNITGLQPSYKYGIHKMKWLKSNTNEISKTDIWLSVADYIVYKLTGELVTDYTLAARVGVFDIKKKKWDIETIQNQGFSLNNFPKVKKSGSIAGEITCNELKKIEQYKNTTVSVSGHDHVCASVGASVVDDEQIFNSMGTAETIMGIKKDLNITQYDYQKGLSFGCHVIDDLFFWLGNITSSGASVEWFKSIIGYENGYEYIDNLQENFNNKPTGIIYFPYLSGSGTPKPDQNISAGFMGIKKKHSKKDLLKAIFEGVSYEFEWILKSIIEKEKKEIIVIGGCTRNSKWLSIKADITGLTFLKPSIKEAALKGSALVAYSKKYSLDIKDECKKRYIENIWEKYSPNWKVNKNYNKIYEKYIRMQKLIRE